MGSPYRSPAISSASPTPTWDGSPTGRGSTHYGGGGHATEHITQVHGQPRPVLRRQWEHQRARAIGSAGDVAHQMAQRLAVLAAHFDVDDMATDGLGIALHLRGDREIVVGDRGLGLQAAD